MKPERKSLSIRIEDDVRWKVSEAAKKDRRSINNWILLAIEEKLRSLKEVAA